MRWVLFAVAAPYAVVVGWLFVIVMGAIGAADQFWLEPYGRLSAQWRPWAEKIWRYSTTIGFGKIFQRRHRDDPRLAAHEETHSQQVEDLMMLSAILGIAIGIATMDPWLGLAVYLSGGLWQLPNFVTAAARYGWRHAYRYSRHERESYATTDTIEPVHVGSSWEQVWEKRREPDGRSTEGDGSVPPPLP